MKSFFGKLSARFPFFANRPSALEHAVRQSPKSRRLRMEPLENRALLAVDAFGGAASLIDSDVGENWGPDPAPAAFSAYVLATDAAIVDVSGVNATLDVASFSVQAETPEPVAPPSFDQLMESLGMIEIESLDDESDVASASYLDEAASTTQLLNSLNLQDISQGEPRQVVFYDSSAADFDESTLNLDDESVYYVDAANANDEGAESYSATPRSGGNSSNSGGSGGSSNSGGSGVSGGGDNSAPFLSGGADKAGYVDLVFSADDANNANKAFTTSVSSWFICSGSAPTYTVDVPQELTCVNVSFNAETSALSVAPSGDVGKGTFTVTAQNAAGSCSVAVNVYSGRVVGYELEERVWGGDWAGVEDSGTAESGVGWNLLWRENEYRWKPVFENGIEPDVVQVRQVVVSAKPTNATYPSSFANGVYNYQGSSGGGTATPEPAPESWPYAIGEPSVNGESEIAMSVTLSGVNLSDNSRYCVAASNNVTLTQQNTPETAADRPRVAITEVQSVTWEAPEVTNPHTNETINNAIRLGDDPHDSENALRCFPEEIILEKDESENDEENNENEAPAPLPTQLVNQVNVKVTLASSVPVDMVGRVSLNWFDPCNLYGSLQKLTVNKAAGPRDNNGTADLSTIQLTFTASTPLNTNVATLTVSKANAGDNYIVAAHPNVAGLANYEFADAYSTNNDVTKYSSTITYTDPITDATAPVLERLQTPQLTVWRTLWVECDQMYYYETYGDNDDSNDETLIAPALVLNDIAQEAFAEACVNVVEYPQDVESRLFSGYGTLDYPLNNSQTASLYNARQSNLARETHWTVQAISAFRLWISGEGQPSESKLGFTSDYYVNTAFVLNSNIENMNGLAELEEEAREICIELCSEMVLAHELGHLMVGSPHFDNTIMHPTQSITDGLQGEARKKFNVAGILKIQERTQPL